MNITKNLEIIVESEICLTPEQCYRVDTYLPFWITGILAGCVYLIIKDIIK